MVSGLEVRNVHDSSGRWDVRWVLKDGSNFSKWRWRQNIPCEEKNHWPVEDGEWQGPSGE